MPFNTPRNYKRFDDIAKRRVRKDLGKLVEQGKIYGQKGKDRMSIPIPGIKIPKFKYGPGTPPPGGGSGEGDEDEGSGHGIGQGPGNIGDPIDSGGQQGEGQGGNKAGEGSTENIIETDISLEEIAEIMQEDLELPNLEQKPNKQLIEQDRYKWAGLRRVGPDGLRRYKPSYTNALKRHAYEVHHKRKVLGDAFNPRIHGAIIPREDEWRYLSWKTESEPETSAVIIYMMDISGSMSDNHKEIARRTAWWTDLWLRHQYKGLESIYIIHDYDAEEVDEDTFYHVTRWGGTRFLSAYDLANRVIDGKFPADRWNIYLMHFTDGENWGDGSAEFKLLEDELMDKINMFMYAQIDYDWWSSSPYYRRWGTSGYEWEGPFLNQFREFVEKNGYEDKLRTTQLKKLDDVYPDAMKELFGKAR